MVPLDHVIAVFDLVNGERNISVDDNLIDGRLYGAALVYRDLAGLATFLNGPLEEPHSSSLCALCRQKKNEGCARLADRPIQIFPSAVGVLVPIIHPPAAVHRALVFAKDLFQQRQKPVRLLTERGMFG